MTMKCNLDLIYLTINLIELSNEIYTFTFFVLTIDWLTLLP
jgi:hypothetical protein